MVMADLKRQAVAFARLPHFLGASFKLFRHIGLFNHIASRRATYKQSGHPMDGPTRTACDGYWRR